ncbi:Uma2 family endonuclease [Mariniblastus fucicola]|uniref:Uma2 family endonuclease n=1 Tax=Mariniblastus fucicola TaxID=980251 RepID=UPI00192E4F32|nr:Uma2 family endonuclease [Mariniblastus fucicola]
MRQKTINPPFKIELGRLVRYYCNMSNAKSLQKTSIADYLKGELDAKRRHEFVDGVVYAMVGARNRHNMIATNATISMGGQLRESPCMAFNSDTKIRIQQSGGTRFYYPDAMVDCDSNPDTDTFQDKPVVVVEVISESTRRTDEKEKRDGYLSINSLQVYLRVEQGTPCVKVDRRNDECFDSQLYEELSAVIPLPEIGMELPLSELYRGVTFPGPPETVDEE